MAPSERSRILHVRFSDAELAMLRALADRQGLTASDIVRQLVRREHAATFGEAPPKKTKR